MSSILDELSWRGLITDCTDWEGLAQRLRAGEVTLYCGFDPTADSLHVGNLLPLLMLRRFQVAGHHPIALAGGATGLIGDPSGKTEERPLLSREQLDRNIQGMRRQFRQVLDFEGPRNPAQLLDNAEWVAPIAYLDFLRDVGKLFSVNVMLSKESIRSRMGERDGGMSYTEFSYMLLQAFDFYHLRRHFDCELQVGGSDQWGNITAGIDLCRKKMGARVYGLTVPLLTHADGSKFGKTASGAVWLDSAKTSVYRFYQYWIRADDRDVIRFLKYFTFLPREEIAALEERHRSQPEQRAAHKALAKAVTEMVHGKGATQEAIHASEVLFGGGLEGISEATFEEIAGEVPSAEMARDALQGDGLPVVDLLVRSGLCASKGQARRDIQGGGIYLNNRRETDGERRIALDHLLFGKYLLLRKGKRHYLAVQAR